MTKQKQIKSDVRMKFSQLMSDTEYRRISALLRPVRMTPDEAMIEWKWRESDERTRLNLSLAQYVLEIIVPAAGVVRHRH
jgi:hypothetical protein